MQEAIDECYERMGRYLNPDITHHPIQLLNGTATVHHGRCARTGIEGDIIYHKKSEAGVVPTYTKLLWMVLSQNRVDDTPYRFSFGCIALLPDRILSNVEWASRGSNTRLPNLHVVENTKEVIREAIKHERYLFLSFGKNIDRTLGNGLRYSCYGNLEINGESKLAGLDLTNQSVDFAVPLRLAALNLDWENARRYFQLREWQVNGLTDEQQKEMLTIKKTFGEHTGAIVRLSRQASRQDLRLAKWISQ